MESAENIVCCHQCGMALDVSSFAVGQTVSCPCGARLEVPAPRRGRDEQPDVPQAPPYSGPQPQYGQPTVPCKEASNALVIAIIGFFCVGIILGPIAIAKANKAEKTIKADPRLTGSGTALAARVVGIIATVTGVLALIKLVAIIIAIASTAGGGGFHEIVIE